MAAKKELTTDEKRAALRGLKTEYRRRTYWTDEVLPGLDKPGPAPGKLPFGLEKELHARQTLVRLRSRKLEREGKTADAAQMRAKQKTWEAKVVAPVRKAAETDAIRQFMRTGLRASYLDKELAYRSFSGKPMTAQELLAKVYGSSGIPERALTQRLSNLRAQRAEGDALWNVKYTTPGRTVPRAPRLPNAPAELDLLGLGNPDTRPVAASLAQPRFADGRRAFHQVGGYSYVPEGGMSASLHEAGGHGLNPTDNTGPTGEQLDGKFSRWYYWAGDAERGAFLGDLRKQVWMSQKTDTGDPKMLQKVLKDAWDNPSRYKDMSPAVRKGLMQYHDLMEYKGPDQEVLDLKRRVEQMVKDKSYVNQFASVGRSDTSAMAAAKAGDADRFARSRSFLATDEVPESIFGIPVVAGEEDYTPEDIAFFRKHPEAGGYYDLGDEEGQLPEEPAPVQAAKGGQARRAAYPGSLNNPGNVEKRAERRQGETDSPHERWAMFSTPQDGLYAMADSIRQIADVKLAGKPFTIRSLSEIYAPRKNKAGAKENDTAKYIRNISRYSGIDADAELDRWNPGDMSRLLKTMVRFESGKPHSDWFTDDEYGRAAEILQEGAAD